MGYHVTNLRLWPTSHNVPHSNKMIGIVDWFEWETTWLITMRWWPTSHLVLHSNIWRHSIYKRISDLFEWEITWLNTLRWWPTSRLVRHSNTWRQTKSSSGRSIDSTDHRVMSIPFAHAPVLRGGCSVCRLHPSQKWKMYFMFVQVWDESFPKLMDWRIG